MNVELLKRETAGHHVRVESLLPLMDPQLDREQYIKVLQRLSGFASGWESWLDQVEDIELRLLLSARRRASLLENDLASFDACDTEERYAGPNLSPLIPAYVFGGLYVMEGSTLGGQLIARHLESRLGIRPGVGNAYFHGYGAATGTMWRQLKLALQAIPKQDSDDVIHAARTLFSDFAAWNEATGPGATLPRF